LVLLVRSFFIYNLVCTFNNIKYNLKYNKPYKEQTLPERCPKCTFPIPPTGRMQDVDFALVQKKYFKTVLACPKCSWRKIVIKRFS